MSDSSASDKAKGTMERTKGKAKEAAGKVTDNESLEREGRNDQVKGDTRKAVGHAKDAANKIADAVRDDTDTD